MNNNTTIYISIQITIRTTCIFKTEGKNNMDVQLILKRLESFILKSHNTTLVIRRNEKRSLSKIKIDRT